MIDTLRIVVEDGLVLKNSTRGVVQHVDPLKNGIFAQPGLTSDEEVHMLTVAVILTRPVAARHFLDVLVWMSTISFTVPGISQRTSQSSPLLSSAHQGVARPVTVTAKICPILFTCMSTRYRTHCFCNAHNLANQRVRVAV